VVRWLDWIYNPRWLKAPQKGMNSLATNLSLCEIFFTVLQQLSGPSRYNVELRDSYQCVAESLFVANLLVPSLRVSRDDTSKLFAN